MEIALLYRVSFTRAHNEDGYTDSDSKTHLLAAACSGLVGRTVDGFGAAFLVAYVSQLIERQERP